MSEPTRHPPARRETARPEALETQRVVAIFGPAGRAGYWEPPEEIEASSIFGAVQLDFRDANLYEGVTHVQCLAVFGSIEIRVPLGVEVDAQGTGLFGGFEQRAPKKRWLEGVGRRVREVAVGAPAEDEADPDLERPLLRIRGFALFGSVTVRHG
jgi:hypothetical protein